MWNESNALTIIALNKCNKKPKSVSLLVDHHLKLTWKDRKVFDQKYILLGVKYWRKEQEIAFFCIFWLQPNFLAQNSTIQYNNTHTVPFRHMMLLFMQCNEKCIFFSFFFLRTYFPVLYTFSSHVFSISWRIQGQKSSLPPHINTLRDWQIMRCSITRQL